MACVKSTALPVGATTGFGSEDRGSRGSEERTESARLSDAGSRSEADDVVDSLRSFLFGPSTVTGSRIRGLIDNGYFAEDLGHEPGEETVPEPHPDEAVVFEEFFTTSLRMPLHPMLANILLKFQIQIHPLTPMPSFSCQNIFGKFQASGVSRLLEASRKDMSFTISRGR
jgi:hypothetical protein